MRRIRAAGVAVATGSAALLLAAAAVLAGADRRIVLGGDEEMSASDAALVLDGVGALLGLVPVGALLLLPPRRARIRGRIASVLAATLLLTDAATTARVAVIALADAVEETADSAIVTVVPLRGACRLIAVERLQIYQGSDEVFLARGGLLAVPIAEWATADDPRPVAAGDYRVDRDDGGLRLTVPASNPRIRLDLPCP